MFAPIVVLLRWLGTARFVRLRAKAISLHAQAITRFCDRIGLDRIQRQKLFRLVRDNSKRLGLMV